MPSAPPSSRSPSINTSSSLHTPIQQASAPLPGSVDPVTDLRTSSNPIAAGIGEVLQALIAANSSAAMPSTPIMIECGERVMALGRKRMAAMNGRNAFLYVKSKFGLLSAPGALYLSARFIGKETEEFVEIDMDAWEELVPNVERLKIYQ